MAPGFSTSHHILQCLDVGEARLRGAVAPETASAGSFLLQDQIHLGHPLMNIYIINFMNSEFIDR